MNIIDYVKNEQAGFDERAFDNEDAAVFAMLSYANFELIAPSYENGDKSIKLKDLTDEEIERLCKNSTFEKKNRLLLPAIRESVRFGQVKAGCVMSVKDDSYIEQFYALTFDVGDGSKFISYRGTDSSGIGWEEDFAMMYHEATAAQIDAIEYLHIYNRIYGDTPVRLGGHSKGGILARYAAIYAPEEITGNVLAAYILDSPGFTTKEFREKESYKKIEDRLVQLDPDGSIIGELFHTPPKHIVIKASGKGMKQHDVYKWHIDENNRFEYVVERSFSGRVIHRAVKIWNEKCSREDKMFMSEVIIKALTEPDGTFTIFGKGGKNKVKKILKCLKTYPLSKRIKFARIMLGFVGAYIKSILHYVINGK